MCAGLGKCLNKVLFSASEVAEILKSIKTKAEECATWEGTISTYRSEINKELRKLGN